MDVGRSFTYAFQDPDWVKKLLIGALVSIVPIVNWAALGYVLEIARRTFEGADLPLPEWDDFGNYFVRGLLASIGVFIWMLPVAAIVACPIIAITLAAGDDAAAPIVLSLCVLVPLILIFAAFVLPIVVARYAVERTFGAMFDVGAIWSEIRRAPGPLLINAVIYIVASFIGQLGIIACFVGVIVTTMYSYLIMGHMLGQVYREARGISDTPAAAF